MNNFLWDLDVTDVHDGDDLQIVVLASVCCLRQRKLSLMERSRKQATGCWQQSQRQSLLMIKLVVAVMVVLQFSYGTVWRSMKFTELLSSTSTIPREDRHCEDPL